MHYAIHKLHWSPSQVDEWFESGMELKAFYYASTQIKIEKDKKEADKLKKGRRR